MLPLGRSKNYEKVNWKIIAPLTVFYILGGAYTLAFTDTAVDQKTTLNGVVLADGLATVGMQVSEGQVLVKVKTIAGPASAARANIAGKVTAVLVKPGDTISNRQTVVRVAAH